MTDAIARKPRVFEVDDPALVTPELEAETRPVDGFELEVGPPGELNPGESAATRRRGGFSWGGILATALGGLVSLAIGAACAQFVAAALGRQDWVGWATLALLAIAAFAALVIVLRELVGIMRLARLGRLRKDIDKALRERDRKLELNTVRRLRKLFASRADAKWGLSRLAEHARDVRDPGELLKLADRELLAPLDMLARRTVLKSAKRVATVTAISPLPWIGMLYVLTENLRMMRALATLYGGRPGTVGALRLGRLTIGHILATGGLALTDDLVGQFFGQDLLRRVSRRLGEGAFNGALTARLGVAAVEVTRPMPAMDVPPVRVRDILSELFKRTDRAPAR